MKYKEIGAMKNVAAKNRKNSKTVKIEKDNITGNVPGSVKIHESVIATIVRKALSEVDGVVRVAGNAIVDNIAEIVGSKKIYDRSIAVEMNSSDVSLEVKINVEFGSHVPTVASNAQIAISKKITGITGLNVKKINIVIVELDETTGEDEKK